MGADGALFVAVKILHDYGHVKTLKKLRKEAGDDSLRPENVPPAIDNFNFHALVAGLTADGRAVPPSSPLLLPKVKAKSKKSEPSTTASSKHVVSSTPESPSTDVTPSKPKRKKRHEAASGPGDSAAADVPAGRFKRIQDDVWMDRIEKDELRENSYTMKNDEFSVKAAQELIQVKGKNFRTEKMKKKRASWKGSGEITTGVNSVMFDDSDSD